MMITWITEWEDRYYSDIKQTIAIAHWVDTKGKHGVTSGGPHNPHMVALHERWLRQNEKPAKITLEIVANG